LGWLHAPPSGSFSGGGELYKASIQRLPKFGNLAVDALLLRLEAFDIRRPAGR